MFQVAPVQQHRIVTYLNDLQAQVDELVALQDATQAGLDPLLLSVLDLTRGHPFLVQLLCAEIVALKNEQDPAIRQLARLADVEAAVPEALSHGSFFFADIQQNQVDAVGLALLRLLAAQGEGAVVSREALVHHFPAELDRTLDPLIRRELTEPADGGYRFQVELIRRWLTRQVE